jgi:hypothetical protein
MAAEPAAAEVGVIRPECLTLAWVAFWPSNNRWQRGEKSAPVFAWFLGAYFAWVLVAVILFGALGAYEKEAASAVAIICSLAWRRSLATL